MTKRINDASNSGEGGTGVDLWGQPNDGAYDMGLVAKARKAIPDAQWSIFIDLGDLEGKILSFQMVVADSQVAKDPAELGRLVAKACQAKLDFEKSKGRLS